MFEVLLVSCLIGGAECRTDRIPAGDTLEQCRVTAQALASDIALPRVVQEYPCVPEDASRPPMAMTMIAPGVFVHKAYHGADPDHENGGDLANLSFIVGDDGVAVIDSGTHPGIGAALLGAIRAETDLPIAAIILTHMHPDHAMGVSALKGEDTIVIAHENYQQAMALRAAGYLANLERLGVKNLSEADIIYPGQLLSTETVLSLGERILVISPQGTAHTNNDLTILDTKTGTLFLGDLLFVDHTPAIDGSLLGWIKVMDALTKIDARRAVPGHGPVSVPWPEGAAPLIRYLNVIAEDTRKAIANGMPMLQAIRVIGARERPFWLHFDAFNPRNASAAFQELEWE